MTSVSAPLVSLSHEDWADSDFDIPDGVPLHAGAEFDREDAGEDWDVEMDFGKTGGAKAQAVVAGIVSRKSTSSQMFTIRPPLPAPSEEDEDEDEGVSTIKVAVLPQPTSVNSDSFPPIGDDDFECDFALPSDLTQLSLRPLSLHHQSSKNSLEWGESNQTTSSQSSDAYSTFGFHEISPSTSASQSQPETETDDDEEDLDGLVIPSGLFESTHSAKHLAKLLERKQKEPALDESIKIASPNPEDDMEDGLVIDDDADFSPSRLLLNAQQQSKHRSAMGPRAHNAPSRPPIARPPSRLKIDRPRSPANPPPSSARQFEKLKSPTSPPTRVSALPRSQSQTALLSADAGPSSFLSAKAGSLRGQKSHTGLKPTKRKLVRKASLSSLMETSHAQASGSGPESKSPKESVARYEGATAASRAKAQTSSTGRMRSPDYAVPPARPSTPSSNPAALRLTMPTSSSRAKTRPPVTSVFPGTSSSRTGRTSPLPPRPPSTTSLRSKAAAAGPSPSSSAQSGPQILRKPKRQRTYGDGTELDGFDDLPTDRDKESRYRVVPKAYGNRVPGAMYAPPKVEGKTTTRRKTKDGTTSGSEAGLSPEATTRPLKHINRVELPAATDALSKRRKTITSPPTNQRRKPTLIRNLGGTAAPKVVGEMKWNPQTLRWEGNDQVLRNFDAVVGTSTRPALITQLTGSSAGSPGSSFASGAQRVGNMIFDPTRMCWISALSPEEDEPDVFADLADDEKDGDGWEERGGTIRANLQQVDSTVTPSDVRRTVTSSRMESPSPSLRSRNSRRRSPSESGSDRGSRASMVYDVDDTFMEQTRLAEERHQKEMKGWRMTLVDDRSHLYDIRALATRKY